MRKFLLSCDWGTSSFRLRLVDVAAHEVIGEVTTPNGIGAVYNAWQDANRDGTVGRGGYYRAVMATQIAALEKQTGIDAAGMPVVLSGMASSSIGMEALPYARLPFALDGSHIGLKHYEPEPDFPHEIMLISGVQSDRDVMRGEETQLIGLSATMDLSGRDALFVFPGTHSKHMLVRSGQLVDFKTFMTGEVFALMANHSILKDSIDHYRQPDFGPEAAGAFNAGVLASGSANILNALFTVRTNQLFDLLPKRENGLFLSGLLIGQELRELMQAPDAQFILCGGNHLYQLYKAAMETLGLAGRATIIPSEIVDRAATAGHIRIYENQLLTLNRANL